MARGSVATLPEVTLGRRCASCHRHLFPAHRPRHGAGRSWSHVDCDDVDLPADADFHALASLLVMRTPLVRSMLKSVAAERTRIARISPASEDVGTARVALQRHAADVDTTIAQLVERRAAELVDEWVQGRR